MDYERPSTVCLHETPDAFTIPLDALEMDNHVHLTNGSSLPEPTGFSWNQAWIMMQMRFDGKLGFPGGLVSDLGVPDSTLEDALNREMEEEINLDTRRFRFRKDHHVISHYSSWSNIIQNFYAQEVSEREFKEIEANAINTPEHGHESLGLIRVPLLLMHDGQSGFPSFLRNQFAGISLLQLMIGLRTQTIIAGAEFQSYKKSLPKEQAFTALVDKAIAFNQALPKSFRGN